MASPIQVQIPAGGRGVFGGYPTTGETDVKASFGFAKNKRMANAMTPFVRINGHAYEIMLRDHDGVEDLGTALDKYARYSGSGPNCITRIDETYNRIRSTTSATRNAEWVYLTAIAYEDWADVSYIVFDSRDAEEFLRTVRDKNVKTEFETDMKTIYRARIDVTKLRDLGRIKPNPVPVPIIKLGADAYLVLSNAEWMM